MSEILSVIIPAHQAEKYIAQAVDSVRRQAWTGETEIIVIDDGSTDGTAAAARVLGVQVLQKNQGGAASARNMGLRAATGQLILLLDADDVLTDGALHAMYAALGEGADAVFALAEDFISPELTEAQKAELRPRPAPYGGVLPGCSLIRRQVFDAIGLFDDTMKSGETVAWQLKLRDAGIKTVQIPTVTLKRRLHLTNTGRVQQKQEMANYAALLRKRMKRE
jgi:glycosyltransferase involved in cell wall biosynthesis